MQNIYIYAKYVQNICKIYAQALYTGQQNQQEKFTAERSENLHILFISCLTLPYSQDKNIKSRKLQQCLSFNSTSTTNEKQGK